MLIYLIFSVYLTPLALSKSRQMLGESSFNSLLPTIKSQQFSDSFKGLTLYVDKKVDNEIGNIFLHDTEEQHFGADIGKMTCNTSAHYARTQNGYFVNSSFHLS